MQYDQHILVGMAKGWKDARTEGTVSRDYFKTERNCSVLVIIYESEKTFMKVVQYISS